MPKKPQILKVSQACQSRLFKVETLELRFSNGVERTYERLASSGNGAVMIVAIDAQDNVILIKEYAVGIEDYLITLPKGLIDPGEDAPSAANRELKEEAGFGANKLTVLKQMTSAPNYMGHKITMVLAQDLYPCRLAGDEPEEMEVIYWPLADIHSLIARPDFNEARTIAALYMIKEYLNNQPLEPHQ